jgi:metal-responsive CopG/Arc/MetJ family transcriptional regulator
MRTSLNLPDDLINEALEITHYKTKTELIIYAIKNLVKMHKLQKLKNFKGKINMAIDLDVLRQR